ncbi:hypothetical protein LIX60_23060 [Streptomyces sp. S07_1.15]|uniref:hypothetical protein n=1 Tax=Streptomyces sp. S07_1.15 TaxID=2873925 RepID=UPI001D13EE49|nr:hypothetical protein [Streptomyces sp. S07_1.15]MCC3654285.1 hypothetical protein [Streptomyces sp. S07_1.15]
MEFIVLDKHPTVALEWIRRAGGSPGQAAVAWPADELVTVPVGVAWDVVRLPAAEGWRTVHILQNLGEVGPVLLGPKGVEVMVPVGAVDGWDLPGARVLARAEQVDVPHPRVVAPHTRHRRTWIVPPTAEPAVLTDADALYGAYAAALATGGSAR